MQKYTVSFSEKQERRLEELADKLETTKAEVIRKAISFLSQVVQETGDDHDAVITVKNKEGAVRLSNPS